MSFQPNRRLLRACLISLLLGIAAGLWIRPSTSEAETEALYFVSSGHRLTNEYGFLNYWRAGDGSRTIGAPISEPFEAQGLIVQYFEYARLEKHPQYDGAILRGRLGAEYADALWRSFHRPLNPEQPGRHRFSETGHTLGEPFAAFWETNGGIDVFGFPISEPEWEYVGTDLILVQYFERARLEHRPASGTDAVAIGDLGRTLALLHGIPTGAVDPAGAFSVDNNGFAVVPTAVPPTQVPPTAVLPTAAPLPAPTAV
ncbi:MAG: murein L,D-transpeptidase, partial [Oscillochloris sp.]|nr:murein L,D-transpeptidase [Oscillochloris sp.]